MTEVAIIGIDLAKRVFQAHGAAANGAVVFRKKLTRDRLMIFLAAQPRCIVAIEACVTAHGWAGHRERVSCDRNHLAATTSRKVARRRVVEQEHG
jgi:transposase